MNNYKKFFFIIAIALIISGAFLYQQKRGFHENIAGNLPTQTSQAIENGQRGNINPTVTAPAVQEQKTTTANNASQGKQPRKVYNLKVDTENQEKVIQEADKQKLAYKKIDELNIVQIEGTEKQIKKFEPTANYIEEEKEVRILNISPNDTYYSSQANLTQIYASSAWEKTKGATASPNIIAVVDTGVNGTHADLSGKVLSGNDYVNDGPTAANSDSDDNGHGTEVAGIIAANTNNSVGIAGVDWNGLILPIKVINSQGVGTSTDLAQGIRCAVENGAKVINMSVGGEASRVVEDAVNYAWQSGIVMVAASGNDGAEGVKYPAAYDNVIAVGSVDSNNARSSFSNYGSQIDIVAPGENIYTTLDSGSYGQISGTSASTPEVSAAIGLFLSLNSSFSIDNIKTKLEANAQKVSAMAGQNFSNYYGNGVLNVNQFLISSLSDNAYAYRVTAQGPYSGPASYADPISPGNSAQLFVTLQNTGSQTWYQSGTNPVHLGASSPHDRGSVFTNNQNIRMTMDETSVASGSSGTFRLDITAPSTPGIYYEYYDLVIEGDRWIGSGMVWRITVGNPLSARYVVGGQEPYTSDSKVHLSPGQSTTLTVRFINTSGANWYNSGNNPINLGSSGPHDRINSFTNNLNTRGNMREWGVANGQTGTFDLTITAPSQTGTYNERYDLVVDKVGWIDTGLNWEIVVE